MAKRSGVTFTTMIMTDGKRSVYGTYRVPTSLPASKIRTLDMHKAEQVATSEIRRDGWPGWNDSLAQMNAHTLSESRKHATPEYPAFQWGQERTP